MPEVAAALANVYFDTAASPFLYQPRIFKLAPEAVGRQRVLFGSDYPLLGQARVLRQLREAGLPPEAEAAIAGGNAARLLGIERR
jgi:predicted TIM-barrel fold metal-dependent hydrolase